MTQSGGKKKASAWNKFTSHVYEQGKKNMGKINIHLKMH